MNKDDDMDETKHVEDEQARAAGKAVGYYVTARPHRKLGVAILLGPYARHGEADRHVDRANRHASEHLAHLGTGFWAYGVTRMVTKPGRVLPTGQLNETIGLTAEE